MAWGVPAGKPSGTDGVAAAVAGALIGALVGALNAPDIACTSVCTPNVGGTARDAGGETWLLISLGTTAAGLAKVCGGEIVGFRTSTIGDSPHADRMRSARSFPRRLMMAISLGFELSSLSACLYASRLCTGTNVVVKLKYFFIFSLCLCSQLVINIVLYPTRTDSCNIVGDSPISFDSAKNSSQYCVNQEASKSSKYDCWKRSRNFSMIYF